MKAKITLGIALVLAGFAFVGFFPKPSVASINLISKVLHEYRMAKRTEGLEKTITTTRKMRLHLEGSGSPYEVKAVQSYPMGGGKWRVVEGDSVRFVELSPQGDTLYSKPVNRDTVPQEIQLRVLRSRLAALNVELPEVLNALVSEDTGEEKK